MGLTPVVEEIGSQEELDILIQKVLDKADTTIPELRAQGELGRFGDRTTPTCMAHFGWDRLFLTDHSADEKDQSAGSSAPVCQRPI